MIRNIMFSGEGNYAAFDGEEQVPSEQGNAWIVVLQDKLDRQVIDLKTKVKMPGWWTPDHEEETWAVADLVKTGHLKAHESTKR